MTDPAEIHGDATAAFLSEGYLFGHRRFEGHRTDAVRTRLLGRRVTMLRGHRAVRAFYEGDRFVRPGALPRSAVHSLQDVGSVQTLTGAPHRERKSVFTALLDDDGRRSLERIFAEEWRAARPRWAQAGDVSLLDASARVLGSTALRWLGIGETAARRDRLTDQCLAMIDGAGSFGPRNWVGRARRRGTESWARGVVRHTREQAGRPGSRVAALAGALDAEPDDTVAVELLNLLRPTVAVSRFVMFAGLALHLHPDWREHVRAQPATARAFAQEVRRTTPLFPAVGGIARTDVTVDGVALRAGDWALVDLFATDRHPAQWEDAWRFDPSRFLPLSEHPRKRSAAPIVAQGAGPIPQTHRCPGEPSTVDLLTTAVRLLAEERWTVPEQDLRVDLRRFPAQPASRLRIRFAS